MADEKKPAEIVDWDSLPLEPGADDWDDIPPAVIPAAEAPAESPSYSPPQTASGQVSLSQEAAGDFSGGYGASPEKPIDIDEELDFAIPDDIPDLTHALEDTGAPEGFSDEEPPMESGSETLAAEDSREDIPRTFLDSIELADHSLPPQEARPDQGDMVIQAPYDDDDEFGGLPDIPLESFAGAAAADAVVKSETRPDGPGSFDAPLAPGFDESADTETTAQDAVEIQDDELGPTKVELDLDGIFLDELPEPAPQEPEEIPAEESPAEEAPPQALEPPLFDDIIIPRKRSKIKLMLVIIPAALLLILISYKLFFSSKGEVAFTPELVIDPRVPPREPEPGTLDLPPFYVNFKAPQNEVIIEMKLILHYNDLVDKVKLEEKMGLVRDIILRLTQSKGRQVVADGDLQRDLRQELAEAINQALEGEKVSYVQISQIKLLQ